MRAEMIRGDTLRIYTRTGWCDCTFHPDGGMTAVNSQIVTEDLLKRLEEERNVPRRAAPLGDSHGAWRKQAELPLSLLRSKIPVDAWEDEKAIARLVNDRDHRAFKATNGTV